MNNKAILDFESDEWSDEMREKLIEAIRDKKRIFPVSVNIDCELDIARISLSMNDSECEEAHFATINMAYMDFHSLIEDNGFKIDFGEEPTEEEKKEAIESLKDNPFKDMLKEVSQ